MGGLQNALSAIAGYAVEFIVPGLVWVLLAIGLIQLAHDGIRRITTLPRATRLTKASESQRAG